MCNKYYNIPLKHYAHTGFKKKRRQNTFSINLFDLGTKRIFLLEMLKGLSQFTMIYCISVVPRLALVFVLFSTFNFCSNRISYICAFVVCSIQIVSISVMVVMHTDRRNVAIICGNEISESRLFHIVALTFTRPHIQPKISLSK